MRLKISIPSKTFILGEYLAVAGESSLVATTAPFFEMNVSSSAEGRCEGVHPFSPGGKWLRQSSSIFKNQHVHFYDPHEKKGGCGASTAQFLAIYLANKLLKQESLWGQNSLEQTLFDYQDVAFEGEGQPPSGADLLAQMTGGLTVASKNPLRAQKYDWPFNGKGFTVLRTGQKISTHNHLKNLELNDLEELRQWNQKGLEAFQNGNWSNFCEAIQGYCIELQKKNWVAEHSLALLKELGSWPEIVSLKSCGAMGADTLLLLHEESFTESIHSRLKNKNLEVVGTHRDISSEGAKAEVLWGENSERVEGPNA